MINKNEIKDERLNLFKMNERMNLEMKNTSLKMDVSKEIHGRMNIWRNEYMKEWIYEGMNICMYGCIYKGMNILKDEFMKKWIYEGMTDEPD